MYSCVCLPSGLPTARICTSHPRPIKADAQAELDMEMERGKRARLLQALSRHVEDQLTVCES